MNCTHDQGVEMLRETEREFVRLCVREGVRERLCEREGHMCDYCVSRSNFSSSEVGLSSFYLYSHT